MSKKIDIVFSFDTTGSMYQCIRQVREDIKNTVNKLLNDIQNIRIGIIAHGDYEDEETKYIIRRCELTRDSDEIIDFINNKAEDTCGYDFPECYELCLHETQNFEWRKNSIRRLVMIGDAYPHEKNNNPLKIDWKQEAKKLKDNNIKIYAVQCMDVSQSKKFFMELAKLTDGMYLQMCNFMSIVSLINAICYQQVSNEQLQNYEKNIQNDGKMTHEVQNIINTMLGKDTVKIDEKNDDDFTHIPSGRFQVCHVGERISIKEFVLDQKLPFKVGRGFYQMVKKEKVTDKKEIVLMNKNGEFYSGDNAKVKAQEAIQKGKPQILNDYTIFIQSTSYNRKLDANTMFLYEMEMK